MADEGFSTYFHHTDKSSAKKILETGYIKQSDPKQGDAVHGRGTYLTQKGPDKSRTEVAKNNYDGTTSQFYENKIQEGKLDVAFEVKVREADVKRCPAGERDVHLFEGDLKLSDAKEVKIHVRDNDSVKKYTPKK